MKNIVVNFAITISLGRERIVMSNITRILCAEEYSNINKKIPRIQIAVKHMKLSGESQILISPKGLNFLIHTDKTR